MIRESLLEMEKALSRRSFFSRMAKVAGMVAAYDRFGDKLFADPTPNSTALALQVVSAFGRTVIPVDEDPGWETFEPGINEYCLNVYIKQCFFYGNQLAFDGLITGINAFDSIPTLVAYGPRFTAMSANNRGQFLSDILTGAFEYDGVQDVLGFGGIFMLLGTKETFFLNYPRHLPQRGAEYQILPASNVKTGWDIMRFKGPVGPDEEKALRARHFDNVEVPGVDFRNPYI
jgi:hypothetical protein